MATSSPAEDASASEPIPFRRLPDRSDLPPSNSRSRGVEIDAIWAKVIALAARNWVEDLLKLRRKVEHFVDVADVQQTIRESEFRPHL